MTNNIFKNAIEFSEYQKHREPKYYIQLNKI